MSSPQPIRVLFVCLGNICRSPAAHAVANELAWRRRAQHLRFDSAGTAAHHIADPPHPLSVAEGSARGFQVDHRARLVHPDDFAHFDLVIAMDRQIVEDLERMRGGEEQRVGFYRTVEPHQIQLLRRWDPFAMPGDEDVPDPWGKGPAAYVAMYDIIERTIPPLLDHLDWLVSESG